MKYYMGISALHHDSAVALIDSNGNIINISQEERRTKQKNDKAWPKESIKWSIKDAQRHGHDVSLDNVQFGYYERPFLKLARRTFNNKQKFVDYFKEAIIPYKELGSHKVLSHHKSHALAGCATAPFKEGVYLTVDAIGEFNTTTWGRFNQDTGIIQDGCINHPHSLGLLYSSFTRWLGLKPLEDEYIVMGAAAYGEPKYAKRIFDELIDLNHGREFRLKKNIHRGIEQYFGHEVPVEDWFDWCASIQYVTERVMVSLVEMLTKKYGYRLNLVLSGGVALNCLANSQILKEFNIDNFWILPSPGDSGNALGAAAHVAGLSKLNWVNAFLGDDIDNYSNPTQTLIRDVVGRLERGQIIGWIQGREEFGPRALGHRSLICDPRNPKARDKINLIKKRQEFRPFAPAVLQEKAFSYFDMPGKPEWHNYMQLVSRVRNPEALPAIVHVDGTARVQTVPKSTDPFRRLLEHWDKSTDCAVLLNTSLNIKGQPMISDRRDAINMLLNDPIDAMVIGNRIYWKETKTGLNEDGSPLDVTNYTDYSSGADNMIKGRF